MARKFLVSVDLNKNELQNARIQNLGSAPSSPVSGQVYYDTGTNIMYFYNGTAWVSTSGSAEVIQDTVDTMIIAGTGLDKSYDDNAGTLTLDIDSTVTTNSGTQTLSNKTLTSPIVDGNGIIFEGATANEYETTLTVVDPTADRTITLPNATTTLVGEDTTNTFTNKTFDTADTGNVLQINNNTINSYTGSGSQVVLSSSPSISVGINFNGSSSGQTTVSAEATASGTLTLPAATDTLVGQATTDTLSNKTLTAPKFVDGGYIADANGNEEIKFTATASAVNELTVANAATGNAPTISATGGDTNIDLNLAAKGTGKVKAGGVEIVTLSGTQELTNKTLTNPTVSGLYLSDSSIVIEGSSADGSETTLQVTNPTDDRTITFPDASGTVILSTNKVTDLTAPTSDFSMNNNKITNLAAPSASSDAATKAYVDAVSEGLHIHAAARAYIESNIDLSTDLEAGDVVDTNVTLVAGDRVLVNGQTTQSQNGIYVVQASGAAVRALDFDTAAEVSSGDFIFVSEGFKYASTGWVQTLKPATIGSDPISFTQFSGAGTYLASDGIYLQGSTFKADVTPTSGNPSLTNTGGAIEVKTDTTRGLSVDANGLGINAGTGLTFSAGALVFASGYGVRKYAASIGDASATSIAVTHGLGTKDVTVHIYDNASPYAQVEADVEHTDTNNVTLKFAIAPTSNQYRVVIVG